MAIVVSATNEGPVVNVAAWFGTTVMVLGVCSRIWSKYSVLQRWTVDDTLIIVTMILGCTVTATISMTVTNGLGSPQSSLSDHQVIELEKYGYASQLLYIPALCITKLTTLVYLRALSPDSRFEVMNTLLEVFVVLRGLGAEFAIAFQCKLPSPWAIISGKCFNIAAVWISNGACDILTDVLIVLLPLYLVWSLQMPRKRKSVVTMAFGSRVLVIPLTVWRTWSLSSNNSDDRTLTMYYGYLTTTVQLNLAIFMACVTFLRPFMETLVSGGMATTVNSMHTSYARSSKLSSFLSSRSERKAPKPKPAPSYKMENLSEVGLNDNQGIFGKSKSNTNSLHTDVPSMAPSINNDGINYAPATSTKEHELEDFEPLRPDKVMSVSRVSNPPLEENTTRSPGGAIMGITRTRQWEVQEEYKYIDVEDQDDRAK